MDLSFVEWCWWSCSACLDNGCEELSDNISANPYFVNETADDYHLLPFSPNIETGVDPTPWLPDDLKHLAYRDFDGHSRPIDGNGDGVPEWDIGAFEYRDP